MLIILECAIWLSDRFSDGACASGFQFLTVSWLKAAKWLYKDMATSSKRLFLTGASGLLGRVVYRRFVEDGWEVYGVALSRLGTHLHKLDLRNHKAVEDAVTEFKPNFVIHCAAQRFPEKVDSDPNGAAQLNVEATENLAKMAGKVGAPMLYISTDYVFDGKSPPYAVDAETKPINLYGKTKLEGEKVTLGVHKCNLILRVPVLYGPVEYLGESAVTVLFSNLLDTDQPSKISDYERRCPSHVQDIAEIMLQLSNLRLKDESVCGIFHWCGREKFTKYEMLIEMSNIFDLPSDHVTPVAEPPSPAKATVRPFDTTLDTSRIDELGIGQHTPFQVGIKDSLLPWMKAQE